MTDRLFWAIALPLIALIAVLAVLMATTMQLCEDDYMTDWLDDFLHLQIPPLSHGAHDSPADGLCAMEMVAYIERVRSIHPTW